MTGKWDDATKTINFTGTGYDPMAGKDMKVRETFQIVDDKNQLMTMYMVNDSGQEFKTLEVKFTRK